MSRYWDLEPWGGTHVGSAKASPYVGNIYGFEPDSARAELRGRELGVKATSNLDSILNNPEIKLLYIASVKRIVKMDELEH